MTELTRKISLAVLPPLVYGLMRIWFATFRVTSHGTEFVNARRDRGERIIAAFWHYGFLYVFYYLRDWRAAVMVSASQDGEYIARLARRFGHKPVRGSSHQRGFRALREMLEALKDGASAGIVADGSQGPARRAQAGGILMASRSGVPLLPVAWAAHPVIRFKSWDRTLVPLPFARLVLHQGPALHVPPNLDAAGIEHWRQILEDELNRLYSAAWAELGRPPHDADLRGKAS